MIWTDNQHLISDVCLEELHYFAARIELKREWFQDHPRHPHYDLTSARMLSAAIRAGAKVCSTKALVFRCATELSHPAWKAIVAKEESDSD